MRPSITNTAMDRVVPRGIREMSTARLKEVRDRWIKQEVACDKRFILHVVAELQIRASIELHVADAGWRVS